VWNWRLEETKLTLLVSENVNEAIICEQLGRIWKFLRPFPCEWNLVWFVTTGLVEKPLICEALPIMDSRRIKLHFLQVIITTIYRWPVIFGFSTRNWVRIFLPWTNKPRCDCVQGCQIFNGTTYQKEKEYTKFPQKIPNGLKYTKWPKIYQKAIKYIKSFRSKAF
jgi:hypothetical protein